MPLTLPGAGGMFTSISISVGGTSMVVVVLAWTVLVVVVPFMITVTAAAWAPAEISINGCWQTMKRQWMSFPGFVVAGILVVLIALIIHERRRYAAALDESRRLHQQSSELGNAGSALSSRGLAVSEREALMGANREMLRLRGEVALLATQIRSSRQSVTNVQEVPPLVDTQTNISGFQRLESHARVNLGEGQTLALGGWQLREGYSTFILATPNAVGSNSDQVYIEAYALEFPVQFLQAIGLNEICQSAPGHLQAVLSEEEMTSVLHAMREEDIRPHVNAYGFYPIISSNGTTVSIPTCIAVYQGGWTIASQQLNSEQPQPGTAFVVGRYDLGPYQGAPISFSSSILPDGRGIQLEAAASIFWKPER